MINVSIDSVETFPSITDAKGESAIVFINIGHYESAKRVIENMEAFISFHEESHVQAAETIYEMDNTISVKDHEIASLKEVIARLEKEKDEDGRRINDLLTERALWKEQLDGATSTANYFSERTRELRDNVDYQMGETKRALESVSKLEAELKETRIAVEAERKMNNDLGIRLRAFFEENAILHRTIGGIKRGYGKWKREVLRNRREIERLRFLIDNHDNEMFEENHRLRNILANHQNCRPVKPKTGRGILSVNAEAISRDMEDFLLD